jgi:hypothetical protein
VTPAERIDLKPAPVAKTKVQGTPKVTVKAKSKQKAGSGKRAVRKRAS